MIKVRACAAGWAEDVAGHTPTLSPNNARARLEPRDKLNRRK